MRKSVLGTGAVVLAAACVAGIVRASRSGADADAVRQAALRQQAAYWLDEDSRASKAVVCLSVEEDGKRRSLTGAQLQRFAGDAAVRLASDCEERPAGAVESRTGNPAILVTAGEIAWQSADEAWVTAHHYRNAVVSGTRTLRVVREAGLWVCVGPIMRDGPL